MRVIIANRFFAPDESATSRVTTSLAKGLVARGHEVHAVTSRRHHDRFDPLPARSDEGGVIVHRVPTPGLGRMRLWGRVLDYAAFHAGAAWRVRRLVRADDAVIVCTDPPLLSVTLMAALLGSGAGMVNWLHDLFPEAAQRLGLLGETGLFGRILLRLRDASLRRARRNVAPIARMAELLAARGIPRHALAIIHHWSEGDEIRPVAADENPLRREWGLADKIVVGYSGNFGRVHEFGTILDAAERLRARADIVFLLIGDGPRRAFVAAECRRRALENVVLKPLQPRARLSQSLGAADLHLVSLLPDLEPCSIPSKFYGILAAGRPTLFVGDPDGEVARMIRRFDCGGAVAVGEGARLAELIVDLAGAPMRRQEIGARARQAFEQVFHREIGIDAWDRLLRELARPASETLVLPLTGEAAGAGGEVRPQ